MVLVKQEFHDAQNLSSMNEADVNVAQVTTRRGGGAHTIEAYHGAVCQTMNDKEILLMVHIIHLRSDIVERNEAPSEIRNKARQVEGFTLRIRTRC